MAWLVPNPTPTLVITREDHETLAALPDANVPAKFLYAEGGAVAGFYANVFTSPTGGAKTAKKWIGPFAVGNQVLPSDRIIVARTGYAGGLMGDVFPGTTYHTLSGAGGGIAAALAYVPTLRALSGNPAASVAVYFYSDDYTPEGPITVPDGVSLIGLGDKSDTFLHSLQVQGASGTDTRLFANFTCTNAAGILFTGAQIGSVTFRNVDATALNTSVLSVQALTLRDNTLTSLSAGGASGSVTALSGRNCSIAQVTLDGTSAATFIDCEFTALGTTRPTFLLDSLTGVGSRVTLLGCRCVSTSGNGFAQITNAASGMTALYCRFEDRALGAAHAFFSGAGAVSYALCLRNGLSGNALFANTIATAFVQQETALESRGDNMNNFAGGQRSSTTATTGAAYTMDTGGGGFYDYLILVDPTQAVVTVTLASGTLVVNGVTINADREALIMHSDGSPFSSGNKLTLAPFAGDRINTHGTNATIDITAGRLVSVRNVSGTKLWLVPQEA